MLALERMKASRGTIGQPTNLGAYKAGARIIGFGEMWAEDEPPPARDQYLGASIEEIMGLHRLYVPGHGGGSRRRRVRKPRSVKASQRRPEDRYVELAFPTRYKVSKLTNGVREFYDSYTGLAAAVVAMAMDALSGLAQDGEPELPVPIYEPRGRRCIELYGLSPECIAVLRRPTFRGFACQILSDYAVSIVRHEARIRARDLQSLDKCDKSADTVADPTVPAFPHLASVTC